METLVEAPVFQGLLFDSFNFLASLINGNVIPTKAVTANSRLLTS